MFDIAWTELVVIAAVALVVIGPKDMPKAMHTIGAWVGKARRMFQSLMVHVDQLSCEAEMMEQLRAKQNQRPPSRPSPASRPTYKKEAVQDNPHREGET